MEVELDDCSIFVYTPLMMILEKLRAICQQMPEYKLASSQHARARDFYDIHLLATQPGTSFDRSPETLSLARHIFEAKKVPLNLLGRIVGQREFHRPDWSAVRASATGEIQEFDVYFDFVLGLNKVLEPLWIVDSPL